MQDLIKLGKKIYNMQNPREVRRMMVFVARGWFYRSKMEELERFFGQTAQLKELADIYPFVYEQPQRAFFYNKSTFNERINIVEKHMQFIVDHFNMDAVRTIYFDKKITLWQYEEDQNENFEAVLRFMPGQRKEGLLSVMLNLDGEPLYQIIFWITPNRDGEWSMWIGAMQGPRFDDSKEVIKRITKKCHAYRTKNLVLFVAQAVARALNLQHIYAVTNYGYYANNHVRVDRKLKTSFSDFWQEAGGWATNDRRFDELPLIEIRKTMEEVPTRKRAVYRKRFALLDEIETAIAYNIQKRILK